MVAVPEVFRCEAWVFEIVFVCEVVALFHRVDDFIHLCQLFCVQKVVICRPCGCGDEYKSDVVLFAEEGNLFEVADILSDVFPVGGGVVCYRQRCGVLPVVFFCIGGVVVSPSESRAVSWWFSVDGFLQFATEDLEIGQFKVVFGDVGVVRAFHIYLVVDISLPLFFLETFEEETEIGYRQDDGVQPLVMSGIVCQQIIVVSVGLGYVGQVV